MRGADWLSERIIFMVLLFAAFYGLLCIMAFGLTKMVPETLIATALGVIGGGVGAMANAIFRTDKVDKLNAQANADMASAAVTVATANAPPVATFTGTATVPTTTETTT